MTREEFAEKIGWSKIIWLAGISNGLSMLPQLLDILSTKKVAGVSLLMFCIFFTIQMCFAIEGFFKRSSALMYSMLWSMLVSVTIICSVLYYR